MHHKAEVINLMWTSYKIKINSNETNILQVDYQLKYSTCLKEEKILDCHKIQLIQIFRYRLLEWIFSLLLYLSDDIYFVSKKKL